MADDTPTMTTAQAAAALGVAPQSVILWADAGLLQSWRTPGGQRRISAASVQDLIDQHRARDAAIRARSLRVMVVEDHAEMAQLLVGQIREILPQAKVGVVEDGFVALMQAGRDRPDIIVMDVQLPGMDGLAMIRSLRAQPATERLQFILVSSYLPHELQAYGELPADVPFLGKPVATDALRAAIGQVLDR